MITLAKLNSADQADFATVCGPLFEHSPWIAERTWAGRPFVNLLELHAALCETVRRADSQEQVQLIASHPDLVGQLSREGRLTRESISEQAAAGLAALSADEIVAFEESNKAYREKFAFPFVICARENKKAAILAAFPVRLAQTREQEISTALSEIFKIAKFRLQDAVSDF